MSEKIIRYKVVYNPEDKTKFATSAWACGIAEVVYKVGRWAKPPKFFADQGYGLLVFDSIDNAKTSFGSFTSGVLSVYECEVKDPMPIKARCDVVELERGKLYPIYRPWPDGTEMYGKVKLIREIEGVL